MLRVVHTGLTQFKMFFRKSIYFIFSMTKNDADVDFAVEK